MSFPADAAATLPPPITVQPYQHEKTLFSILAVFAILFWVLLTLGTLGIVWIYMVFIYLFVIFAHSTLISYLKGNAVRITEQQFPELHARILTCCHRVGIKNVPESYLMSGDGMLNAFATRFLSRYYVVLLSDVVDALDNDPEGINFYIGHELGHINRKHIANAWWMGPAMMMPIVGAAYRRAQEYTCDQYGLACCSNQTSANRALAVLAAGTKRWQSLNTDAYIQQSAQSGGFWMSFNEVLSDYPWLCKRMGHINSPTFVPPARHPFAWFLAIFIPRTGMGAASPLLGMMMIVAIIGILAAVAIPAYSDYQQRAAVIPVFQYGQALTQATSDHYASNEELPENIAALGITAPANVKNSEMSTDNGVITIQLDKGKEIMFTPTLDDDKKLEWTCSTSLPAKTIPRTLECESTALDGMDALGALMGKKH